MQQIPCTEVLPHVPGTFLNIWHSFKCLSAIKLMKPKMISEPVPPRLPFPSALLLVSYYIMVRIQREAWVQVLALTLTSWVTLDKFFFPSPNLSFLISKTLTIIVPHSRGHCEVKVRSGTHLSAATSRWSQLSNGSHWPWHQLRWHDPLSGRYMKAVPLRTDEQYFLSTGSSFFPTKNLSYELFL